MKNDKEDDLMRGRLKHNRLTTVRGILLPAGWDENGKVIAIGLSGTDEKQYFIEKNGKQEELFRFIQREVEISGLLRERAGHKVLLLKGYRLISGESKGSIQKRLDRVSKSSILMRESCRRNYEGGC